MGARLVHDLVKVGSSFVAPALVLALVLAALVAACAAAGSPPPTVLSISPTPAADGGDREPPPISRARLTTAQAQRARELMKALRKADKAQRADLLAAPCLRQPRSWRV